MSTVTEKESVHKRANNQKKVHRGGTVGRQRIIGVDMSLDQFEISTATAFDPTTLTHTTMMSETN